MKNNNKNRKLLFIRKMNSYRKAFDKPTKDFMLNKFGRDIVMEKVLLDIKLSQKTARLNIKPIIKLKLKTPVDSKRLEEFKAAWLKMMNEPRPIMILDSEPTVEFIHPPINAIFDKTLPNYGQPAILKLLPDLKMITLEDQEKLQSASTNHKSPHKHEPRFD